MGLEYRVLQPNELGKLRELDRSERITVLYRRIAGELRAETVALDSPRWLPDDEGEHSVGHQLHFCEEHLRAGARALACFDGETLVGIALLTPEIRPRLAQLAFLHVSRAYRREGVAARLFEPLLEFAREHGANRIYVSATPTGSAIGFYLSRGFELVEPLPELFALEPEDIHLSLELE